MNGHEPGSAALKECQSYCGQLQVLGSINWKACAFAQAISIMPTRAIEEATMRRIVKFFADPPLRLQSTSGNARKRSKMVKADKLNGGDQPRRDQNRDGAYSTIFRRAAEAGAR